MPETGGRTTQASEELVLAGIGVSRGIAIGPVYQYERDQYEVEERQISEEEIEREVARFHAAVDKSERDLDKIASVAHEKLGEGSASIFVAQSLMLRDESFMGEVEHMIRRDRVNAGYAVKTFIADKSERMKASDNEYIRERSNDFLDVQDRVIRHLRRGKLLSAIDPGTIVVADNLTAADIVLFSRRNILGCATDFGGSTSHVSIMARALGVPAVVSMHEVTSTLKAGDQVILDGINGRVIANPRPETLARYRSLQAQFNRLLEEQKSLVSLPPETSDGHYVTLRANLEFKEELNLLDEFGAAGVGLFRTEFLFLMRGRLSYSEDEQYEIYKEIVESVGEAGTTFRLLDLGGDKMLPMAHRERNPFLGWRGIRVLLDKPDLLRPQVRAILRASAHGACRILLPMVTLEEEVEQFNALLEAVKSDLRERGILFDESVPVGIMVEVPAVALKADRFARMVDFFSIGTNDLTQYMLAVDRGNDLVSDLYRELDPALLSLIKHVVDAAHRHGIRVSLCGELASNPRATPVLVGLGIDELSASPAFLPDVKRVIRSMKFSEAVCIAERILDARGDEVIPILDRWLDDHHCGLFELMDREVASEVSTEPTAAGSPLL